MPKIRRYALEYLFFTLIFLALGVAYFSQGKNYEYIYTFPWRSFTAIWSGISVGVFAACWINSRNVILRSIGMLPLYIQGVVGLSAILAFPWILILAGISVYEIVTKVIPYLWERNLRGMALFSCVAILTLLVIGGLFFAYRFIRENVSQLTGKTAHA